MSVKRDSISVTTWGEFTNWALSNFKRVDPSYVRIQLINSSSCPSPSTTSPVSANLLHFKLETAVFFHINFRIRGNAEWADKPGSVEGSHASRCIVTDAL